MMERIEDHFYNSKGREFFMQMWTPKKWDATLVVTHGMSEHSECYHAFAEDMGRKGWRVVAWDLQGHGRSYGKRGYVDDFWDFAKDLDSFINSLKRKNLLSGPYALLGHSMGGLATVCYLLDHPECEAKAVALSSPALGLIMEVPAYKDKLAHFLNRFLPTFTLQNDILYENLSRDPKVVASHAADSLRHDKVSAPLYLGMLEAMKNAQARANEIQKPIVLQLSGNDKLVSVSAAENFFENLGSQKKKKIIYLDSYHEIYNDLDRTQVIDDLNRELRLQMEQK